MKKTIIIVIVVLAVGLGVGAYLLFRPQQNPIDIGTATSTQPGTLPIVASATVSGAPDGPYLSIGTTAGTVQINNFYLTNPPIDDGGDIVIKQTDSYTISYDPTDSSFWIGISAVPFMTWQPVAEQDFLTTLGVSKADACKLKVTSGAIYSLGNPFDGASLPLSFCAGGAFQTK